MEKNKNIVLVLLFIIIAVMACFGIKMSKEIFELKKGNNTNINENQNYNNNDVNNNQNNNQEQQQNIVPKIDEEIIVEDASIKNELSRTIDKLVVDYSILTNEDLFKKLKIDNETRLIIALKSFYNENRNSLKKYVKDENSLKQKELNNLDGDLLYMAEQIDASMVESEYKKLFDSNIVHQDTKHSCPQFYYDQDNNIYYATHLCGGTGPSGYGYGSYINKILSKGNTYYVYYNLGFFDPDAGVMYYDGINKEKPDNLITNDRFVIDESNYDKFSEYKFTFEKNSDGNYIFKSIERIK